jgi:hypothetical protein
MPTDRTNNEPKAVVDLLTEFRTLLNSRDYCAYHMVDIAMAAMAFINLGEFEKAQNILQGAVLDYQLVEEKINKFYAETSGRKHSQKESAPDGNQSEHSAA